MAVEAGVLSVAEPDGEELPLPVEPLGELPVTDSVADPDGEEPPTTVEPLGELPVTVENPLGEEAEGVATAVIVAVTG